MSETVEDLTIRYEENGTEIVKELEKHVLTKGAWATVMFLYQDLDRQKQTFSEPKVTIRRYKKAKEKYMQQSKFNISSKKQAMQIVEILNQWYAEE